MPFRVDVCCNISLSACHFPLKRKSEPARGRDLPSPLFSTTSFNFTLLTQSSAPAVMKKVLDNDIAIVRAAGALLCLLFFREEGEHLLNVKERLGNTSFQPELPDGMSQPPSFTSIITALRSAMSWILRTMTRNASGLDFPGGQSLLLSHTL